MKKLILILIFILSISIVQAFEYDMYYVEQPSGPPTTYIKLKPKLSTIDEKDKTVDVYKDKIVAYINIFDKEYIELPMSYLDTIDTKVFTINDKTDTKVS